MGFQPGASAVQTSVVGSGPICIVLLSLGISESGDVAEECYGAEIRLKSPNQEDLSAFLGSKPEG